MSEGGKEQRLIYRERKEHKRKEINVTATVRKPGLESQV